MYTLYVIDTIGDHHILKFKIFEYKNLMELLINRLYDDIGACKGRGLCGTCHIRINSSIVPFKFPEGIEKRTLFNQLEYYSNSRLACQVLLDKQLDNSRIEIIGGD
ncbi:2Fe-2S iron-sulfur cluster-binding protein [uncultured Aquimarina sp.]|uniref:2Fe-2S iron-sulfur cluster-binding protein n=1 Tax=uncultured Aquimarina sp. TaxID=575652 RepID=UPI002638F45E|nr:2Fe-2S iron-sulfur cluster-binding protein [uncultured Aquimarina sp.]